MSGVIPGRAPQLFKFGKSIRAKVTAAVLLAVLSATLLGSLASAWREANRRFDSKREELKGVAATLAASVAPSLAKGDARHVANTLNSIGRIPGIKFARVIDADNRVVYEVGNGVLVTRDAEPMSQAEHVGPYSAIFLSTFPVAAQIVSSGISIGRIDLIADISELKSTFITSIWQALLAGILAALVGIALSWRLQRSITDPIARLTSMVEDVGATGDYRRSVPRLSSDETGRLVDAFNGMVGEIRKRDDALSRHADKLEDQVRERTKELTVAKQAAEAADAAKSDFLATMSHEIRTPMNGMLVMAELLSASGLTPRLQRYSDIIVKSGQSLVAIINDILDLSKIEAGRMELEAVPVDPAGIVDDVLKLFSERASSKNLDLAGYVGPDVPACILADPVRLNQVLSNLVNNALKFTETGGVTVNLTCAGERNGERPQQMLRFAVADTGIGIAKDKIPTIFSAFSQADQSTTRNFGGTGIGLTISQKLVAAMGGSIRVASDVGKGSEFSFACAFALDDAEMHASGPEEDSDHAILLLMPDGPSRQCLERYVRDAGMLPVAKSCERAGVPLRRDWRGIFADATVLSRLEWPQEDRPLNAPSRRPDCSIVAVSNFGDATADLLVNDGRADAMIDRPLSPMTVSSLLRQLRQDGRRLATRNRTQDAKSPSKIASFAGVHVLAADDSAVNREVLIETLARLDVHITCVNDGQAAIDAARAKAFDLIFMDGSMPNVDGFAAARAIRSMEAELERPRVPIIALTAHVLGEQATRWRDAGMCDHISKPFALKTIQGCLERWIGPGRERAAAQDAPEPMQNAARADAPLLMDRSVLAQIAEMQAPGDDLVRRILGLYLDHAPHALERLSGLVDSDDTNAVAEAAHALKSLSRNVGASRVGDLCGEVEAAARDGHRLTEDTCGVLTSAFSNTLVEVDNLREEQPDHQADRLRA